MVDARTRYWKILSEITWHRFYWQKVYDRIGCWSFILRLVVAAFTCGAVTALVASDVAWIKAVATVCAVIGPVANAVLTVFGYEAKMATLQDALSRTAVLSLVMEKDWYRIDDEKLGHDEIVRMCVYYDGLWTCMANGLSRCNIAFDKKMMAFADENMAQYLENLHPVEPEAEQDADDVSMC